ncbi:metalloregulator ArsR/SmtB family transcription factor [Amycolatopsis sp. cmx-4-68]|uniref:metalloregulator ArsR/SmtB family transcription factor n=1 Tax=Amycolatopsis sp. cmx-4-68 TaxID=2790938 RepID=UPI00397C4F1C
MERIAAALGDAARWRLVELLAERPRSVGELAGLTGLRQPQTTKHLQTLARAGLVTVFPLGQRRVYALEAEPLTALADRLGELARATAAHEGEREVVARYRAAIEAETALADRDRWADGRVFAFERVLAAPPETVWRHWTDPGLLASWWAPPSMTVTACVLEPRVGGRAELAYRDADGEYRSEGRVRVADEPGRLGFDLAVTGAASFTGHYDLELSPAPAGTRLRLGLRITGTTVGAVAAIAGVETGWGQVLDQLAEVCTPRKDEST